MSDTVTMMVLAIALAALAISPPSASGQWQQVGAAVTSKPGKALHFVRLPMSPTAVGIVVTSTSSRRIRLSWGNNCDDPMSGDQMSGQTQGVVTAAHRVVAYPPVTSGATRCYVSINTNALAGAKISAAVFATQ